MCLYRRYLCPRGAWRLAAGLAFVGLGVTNTALSDPPPADAAATSRPTSTAPAATEPATTQPAISQRAPNLRDAHDLYVEGYYERAVEQYTALAAEPAHRLDATLGLVRCHLMTGAYADAEARLAEVQAEGARSADWFALAAETDSERGRYAEAIEQAQTALRLDKRHFAARILLGRLFETLGRTEEAIETYRWFETLLNQRFPETADAVTETAKGFNRYNLLTNHPNLADRTDYVLNKLLQVAYTQMDRTCWPARVAAADLLASRYNLEEATEDYKAALRINSHLPEAHVGLGRVALDGWDFDETERRVDLALAVNPRYVPAFTLRAEQKLTERRYAEAAEACAKALEINPHDLRALALAAAAALCRGEPDAAKPLEAQAEALNPRPAVLHAILADVLGGLRQYAESEAHYLQAIEFDPNDANTRCELGMMYMQWGDEAKARAALDAAWALDQYNARTKYTLDLLDTLTAFATQETAHFIIRYDAAQDGVLPHYMAGYLEDIYGEVCADFATQLADKTIIEVFPSARAFGVRITGKPWIVTVGACTGRVIALCSPRRDPALLGPFDYARVLRHEFTHTVTLAATRNRIPHWFTEGLAVTQEDAPRSFDWCEMLAERVRRNELFTLQTLDWGFMRPRRHDDRQVAYAQSQWMCEYLVERFGYDILYAMLVDYRDGRTQEEVFLKHTGQATQQFDIDFAAWARRQAGSWGFPLDPPEEPLVVYALTLVDGDNAALLGRLARAEFDAAHLDKALDAANKALALDEKERNALEVYVTVLDRYAAEKQDPRLTQMEDEMLPALRRLAELEPDGWTAPKLLAKILLRREQLDDALEYLTRLQRVCPRDPFSYSGLAGIYLTRQQPDLALPQLLELARTDEHDPDVPARIGAILAQRGKLAEARHWCRQALFIDPFQARPHRELASVLMRLNDTAGAAAEYEVLCQLEPKVAGHFADAALAHQKLGNTAKAQEYARKAVALDANSPARPLLN